MKGYRKLLAFLIGIIVFTVISLTTQVQNYEQLGLGIGFLVLVFTVPNIAEYIKEWFQK